MTEILEHLETVEKQCEIIKIQSEAIAELYELLLQHIEVEEWDALPAVKRLKDTKSQ